MAGVAHWINSYFGLKNEQRLDKKDARIEKVKAWVDAQYTDGRTTALSDDEIAQAIQVLVPELTK